MGNLGGGYVTVPFAYIAKMIPHKLAVIYQGRVYAAIFCAVCIGPIIAGFIAHTFSYQWSFIVVTILNGILLIYIVVHNIKNKQSDLLQIQLSFMALYQQIIDEAM